MNLPLLEVAPPPALREDRLFGELLRLAWPIAISVLSYSVMTLVDTYFVARLGAAEVGGVGLGGLSAFTVICFGIGLLRAVKIVTAQELGAGRGGGVRGYLGAGLCVAAGLSLAFTLLALPIAFVLPHLAAGEAVGRHAHHYMLIRVVGTLPVLCSAALREARQGSGDTRSPMWISIIVNLLHIPLNYLLIFRFELGVAGAAWSTVCVQILELCLLSAVQQGEGFGLRRATLGHAREILRVGLANGIELVLSLSAFTALVALVAQMSEADLAAHQIAIQVIHFAFLPLVALGEGASVLSGRAVGANRDDLVPLVAGFALRVGLGYALFSGFVLAFLARPMFARFSSDPQVLTIGVHLLWVAAGFQLFDAVDIVLRSVLRGTGDVQVPALQAIASAWTLIPPLTYWLGLHLGLGALGGWLALTVNILFGASFLGVRTLSGGWRAAAQRSRARLDPA
jgi:MATE family multidrug resistance protein